MLSITNLATGVVFPSTIVNGRKCFAVPFHAAFAIRVDAASEAEVVIAVDGRDTLSNQPASPALPGIIIRNGYTCPGFQTSNGTAASFVHMPKGAGLTTAERNGSADSCGLVAAVLYAREETRAYMREASTGMHAMRGDGLGDRVTRGGSSGGAMAGVDVSNRLGETQWTRGRKFAEDVVEYDTREGWLARGVVIPDINTSTPWPGAAPQFAARSSL